ncbi:MAG: hypothetical protein WAZ14_04175 [Patescibacteria group bacterium]
MQDIDDTQVIDRESLQTRLNKLKSTPRSLNDVETLIAGVTTNSGYTFKSETSLQIWCDCAPSYRMAVDRTRVVRTLIARMTVSDSKVNELADKLLAQTSGKHNARQVRGLDELKTESDKQVLSDLELEHLTLKNELWLLRD